MLMITTIHSFKYEPFLFFGGIYLIIHSLFMSTLFEKHSVGNIVRVINRRATHNSRVFNFSRYDCIGNMKTDVLFACTVPTMKTLSFLRAQKELSFSK